MRSYIFLTVEAEVAFNCSKKALAAATLVVHPKQSAQLCVYVDASDVAIGGTLLQHVDHISEPIAFFSKILKSNERKLSAYDRELFAAYQAITYFKHVLEGRVISIYTDHKPLILAFKQKVDKCSPRQFRHLENISQFTTDIRYVTGSESVLANALLRIKVHAIKQASVDLYELSKAQQIDIKTIAAAQNTSLLLEYKPLYSSNHKLLCDTSTCTARTFVPLSFRRRVFQSLHNLAHPGISASRKLVTSRFV